jgi:hypothetical protein
MHAHTSHKTCVLPISLLSRASHFALVMDTVWIATDPAWTADQNAMFLFILMGSMIPLILGATITNLLALIVGLPVVIDAGSTDGTAEAHVWTAGTDQKVMVLFILMELCIP